MAHKVKCIFVTSLLCVFNVLCVLLLLFCLLQSDSRSIQLNTFSSVSALESHLEVQNCCYLRFLFGLNCWISNSFILCSGLWQHVCNISSINITFLSEMLVTEFFYLLVKYEGSKNSQVTFAFNWLYILCTHNLDVNVFHCLCTIVCFPYFQCAFGLELETEIVMVLY